MACGHWPAGAALGRMYLGSVSKAEPLARHRHTCQLPGIWSEYLLSPSSLLDPRVVTVHPSLRPRAQQDAQPSWERPTCLPSKAL